MSEGREFQERWLAAVAGGDLEALSALCDPEIEIANKFGTFTGPDQVVGYFKGVLGVFSDREYAITNLVECGDTVVCEFIERSVHSGPLPTPRGPIPATGRPVAVPVVVVNQLRGGLLWRSRLYVDRLEYLEQLGLMGAPAGA